MSITIIDDYGNKTVSVDYVKKNFSLSEIERKLSIYQKWLIVAAIASFLASAMSVVKYMAGGSLDPFLWTGEQAFSALTGLGIVALIVAGETFLFSSGYRGIPMALLSAAFVGFGLFTEITQAMERENEGVSIRSQQSPTYQAALESIGQLSKQSQSPVSNPYALQISKQAQVVARCERRVKDGRESHCEGDKARLNALQGQATAALSAAAQGNSATIVAALNKAKEWERDEEQHYGMIKLLKSWFGVTATSATFIFSFIIIATFRVAFWWIGDQVATYKQALERSGGSKSKTLEPETQNAKKKPSVLKSQPMRTGTQNAKPNYEAVSIPAVVRLATPQLLCQIADGKLASFSIRPVNDALKELGFGKSNEERKTAIYPVLADEFEKEGYTKLNPDWIEFKEGDENPNGKRQKWIVNKQYCTEKARAIPRG